MSLSLDQLPALLSLPCVLDVVTDITEQPILADAKRFGSSEFLQAVMTDESLGDFLHRVYKGAKTYRMNASIYSQLAALVLSDTWPYMGGFIFLYINPKTNDNFLTAKVNDLGCLKLDDNSSLHQLPDAFKELWAVRVNHRNLLSLTDKGPKVLDIADWVIKLRTNLEEFGNADQDLSQIYEKTQEDSCYVNSKMEFVRIPRDYHIADLFVKSMRGLVRCSLKLGKLDNWGFYPTADYIAISAVYNNGYVFVQEFPRPLKENEIMEIIYPPSMAAIYCAPNPSVSASGTIRESWICDEDCTVYEHFHQKLPRYDKIKVIGDNDTDGRHIIKLMDAVLSDQPSYLDWNNILTTAKLPKKEKDDSYRRDKNGVRLICVEGESAKMYTRSFLKGEGCYVNDIKMKPISLSNDETLHVEYSLWGFTNSNNRRLSETSLSGANDLNTLRSRVDKIRASQNQSFRSNKQFNRINYRQNNYKQKKSMNGFNSGR